MFLSFAKTIRSSTRSFHSTRFQVAFEGTNDRQTLQPRANSVTNSNKMYLIFKGFLDLMLKLHIVRDVGGGMAASMALKYTTLHFNKITV